jgi:N-carbamoyl-L-amino-acid hydrolase
LAVRNLARDRDGVVATVGALSVQPGAFNVVPGAAQFDIDVRSIEAARLARAEADVCGIVKRVSAEEQLAVTVEHTFSLEGRVLDDGLMVACEAAADREGASHRRMPSGAGHDAMIIGKHVPAAMLFVPSRNGISHNPAEHTNDWDCERGVRVLARVIQGLAGVRNEIAV